MRAQNKNNEKQYIEKTLSRINKKYNINVVYVENVRDIETYVLTHPVENKIGFIVIEPSKNVRSDGKVHVSPIYFERIAKENNTESFTKEYFMQFDSTGRFCVLPKSGDVLTRRVHGYSPFSRQTTHGVGCFEDACTILKKCFQEENMISFFEQNKTVWRKNKYGYNDDEKNAFNLIWLHSPTFEPIVDSTNEHQDTFYTLNTLPAKFLSNIENYQTMRHFREKEPEKFNTRYKDGASTPETVEQHIKRKGMLRSNDTKLPTQDKSKKSDIRGQDFGERRIRYQIKAINESTTAEDVNKILPYAVNKFLEEHPPKFGSFWYKKNKSDVTLEAIVRHACGENDRGKFFGYSGHNTKKILQDDYGVVFDEKFAKLSIQEKINIVLKKIYNISLEESPIKGNSKAPKSG